MKATLSKLLYNFQLSSRFTKNTKFYAWLVWLTAALFYSIEYLQRVSPTVMALPLMQAFHLNATQLSAISSLYFYAYALAQIPVGILLDRFGARRLLTIACITISIGGLLFAIAKILLLLAIARILIGFGSAFAFIGVLKLASNWFAEKQYPIIVGLTNTLGVIGAVIGQAPLALLMQKTSWANSMIIISLIGLVISLLIWLIIKDEPICLLNPHTCQKPKIQNVGLFTSLKIIVSNFQTWLTAVYAALMVVPIIAFGELWAVPFLHQQYHLSMVAAAEVNAAIFIGIGVGGPVNGWLASHFNRPITVMVLGNSIALLALLFIIYGSHFAQPIIALLLFALGFFTSSMLIAFTLNKQRHLPHHNGTVIAFTNMIIVVMGAVAQNLIGSFLDHFTTGAVYSLTDFHYSLALLPLVSLLSLIFLIFIRK